MLSRAPVFSLFPPPQLSSRGRRLRAIFHSFDNAVAAFAKDPQPPGTLLQWVCREEMAALDLLTDRLALTPA